MMMLSWWKKLSSLPMGKWLFSRLVGVYVPYSGSIGADVVELRPGFAKVELRDRRKVRNHLDSVHAVAQMNLGELATGLAMFVALPADARLIVSSFQINFVKKARGRITAVAECEVPKSSERQELVSRAKLVNEAGVVVSEVTSHILVGPKAGPAT